MVFHPGLARFVRVGPICHSDINLLVHLVQRTRFQLSCGHQLVSEASDVAFLRRAMFTSALRRANVNDRTPSEFDIKRTYTDSILQKELCLTAACQSMPRMFIPHLKSKNNLL